MYNDNQDIFNKNTNPNPNEEPQPEIIFEPVTDDTPSEEIEIMAPIPDIGGELPVEEPIGRTWEEDNNPSADDALPGDDAPSEDVQPAQSTSEEEKGQFSQNVWSEPSKQTHKKHNKRNFGRRVLILLLCGILLGSSGAAAYLGVLYVGKKVIGIDETEQTTTEQIEIIDEIQSSDIIDQENPSDQAMVTYDVTTVVENVMPAMVSIINNYTQEYSSFFGQSYTQQGASSGSGIIIGQNDVEILIATNYHVISGNDSLEITFIDATTAQAYVKGTNPQMDLAVVSVALNSLSTETKASIAVATMGDSDSLKLGEAVIAIGNALGYGQSVTTGVVSAIDREISMEDGTTGRFIQTDAAINPGNSGGALLNVKGQVIGINSSKIGGTYVEGIGYAIPISAAEPIISDLSLLETKFKVNEEERGYLGISVDEISAELYSRFNIPQGVYVTGVQEGSGADLGGMKVNDIIVGFDSFLIKSYDDLQEAMQYYKIGDTVPVEVMRIQNGAYESVTLEITLGTKPE